MNDVDIEVMVRRVTRAMRCKFARAHYNVDIEEIAWYSVYLLSLMYEWEQTYEMLWLITYREIIRELNKVRNVFVVDPDLIPTTFVNDEYSFEKLTFKSLNKDEHQYIAWMINDGLTKTDIAELTGVSMQTVYNKWHRIVDKLKQENI